MAVSSKTPNRLINEKSPYLLQHANNPVDWFPWGDEAFEKAKAEDKPVFLSIGYSTCHWCHVMERESFEDAEAADALNSGFVSVKVDKEERPDIDSIYMEVCQMMTGSGGWPLTVIMTPEQVPFYAATYLPKRSKRGMPGLIELLDAVRELWNTNRERLLTVGKRTVAALEHSAAVKVPGSVEHLPEKAYQALARKFDGMFGGFGGAPKFPSAHNLLFLMRAAQHTGGGNLMDIVETTLGCMYRGGIFDHIGGGFSRYSTDRLWLVPHFEKMLYDNALLALAYTEAYALTGSELYKFTAQRTLKYIENEMTDSGGGFYSAQDADSDGIEGKYYVLTPREVKQVLGDTAGKRFCEFYDITDKGNFEGASIPNRLGRDGLPDAEMLSMAETVYRYRKNRCRLSTDDKILTAWNGLMLAAFARAYSVFGDTRYLDICKNAVSFIIDTMWDGERLYASYRDGRRSADGYLDDSAFTIFGLLYAHSASPGAGYFDLAQRLTDAAVSRFWDNDNGGFFLYSSTGEQLIHRPKETYDGAMPSGNSVMLYNLQRLPERYAEYAQRQTEFMAAQASAFPEGFCFAQSCFMPDRERKSCPGGVCTL